MTQPAEVTEITPEFLDSLSEPHWLPARDLARLRQAIQQSRSRSPEELPPDTGALRREIGRAHV